MSKSRPTDVQSIGTTDDAPLDPTTTTIVSETAANGRDGELLGYHEFAATVSLATDTITRVVEDSQ